ncbi:MAG: hypothetical protein JEZ12_23980 [Desulfobacterium sp.]|nr:hypothetical protein [Desulfobacterium sp.]
MPLFSDASNRKLDTCHPDLQRLFRAVVQDDDCTILEGHRGRAKQNRMVREGKSKVEWPDGKHNPMPSEAADVAPYIKGFGPSMDPRQCSYFAAKVKAKAEERGIPIRWGGDWDGDGDLTDQTFNDLLHYELIITNRR